MQKCKKEYEMGSSKLKMKNSKVYTLPQFFKGNVKLLSNSHQFLQVLSSAVSSLRFKIKNF